MFDFEDVSNLIALFCGLAVLFAVLAALAGGPKGFATFVVLWLVTQVLPEGSGWLLLIIVLCVVFLVNDATIEISSGPRGHFSRETRDYSINYGAAIFGLYCLVDGVVGSFIIWQMLQTSAPLF